MAYDYQLISKIQRPGVASPDNIRDTYKTGIYTVIGTQTAKTGAWTGALHGVPALYDGLTINYYLPYDGDGNATLTLTLDDGTTTGAVNCYITTSRLTTHQGAGRTIVMTYQSAGSISVKGTATTDNRWICDAYYDTNNNDTAYYVRRYYPKIVAGANKIFPYTIIMQNADGRWESIVTSSSTGTSKARNTHGFRLGQLLLMYANATYAENAEIGNTNVWEMHSLFDHRQSFNTANNATSGTVTKKPYYLVGSINSSDGLFYLDTTWWTKDLPSTEDGKFYIYLGDAYDYYRMSFAGQHPIYHYVNGMIREFMQDAGTVNGLTVQTAVPVDAEFTDTTYSLGRSGESVTLTPTGSTAQSVTLSSLINGLSEGSSPAQGNDYLVAQYAGGGTTTTTYHRRKVSNIVNGANVKAALGTDTSTTTQFLNKKGEWSTPAGTTYTGTTPISVSGTTISHANSGVTAGTYRSVTVNATGHVTAGTNPTTLSGYGITDAKIANGVITLGSNTITPLTASSTLNATKLSGTIPSGCYTDTKNTTGSTDTSSKIYLVGATSQAANPQTYSDNEVYTTSGTLTTNKVQVGGGSCTLEYNTSTASLDFIFS